jgi:hypothetical protein
MFLKGQNVKRLQGLGVLQEFWKFITAVCHVLLPPAKPEPFSEGHSLTL